MFKVYALFASDEPLQVRYVGLTRKSLEGRLDGHWAEGNHRYRKDWRKLEWMKAVRERGAEVQIRLLSAHGTEAGMIEAERIWMMFWAGVCDLLNLDWRKCQRKERAAVRVWSLVYGWI